jgi:hypothetical protein
MNRFLIKITERRDSRVTIEAEAEAEARQEALGIDPEELEWESRGIESERVDLQASDERRSSTREPWWATPGDAPARVRTSFTPVRMKADPTPWGDHLTAPPL